MPGVDDQPCACVEPSCRCTTLIPNDGETRCPYCLMFDHAEG
jgi:hypothetical protein